MRDTRALGTAVDVSEYLCIPVTTLYEWRHRGTGPRSIRVGRHLRYRWSDVDAWLEERAAKSGHSATAVQEAS